MRIRSTKPEFWRSETISQLDLEDRLILKALESYVDDNGVGKDSVVMIAADAFPHDLAKSSEICAKISGSLARFSEAGLIVRYKVAGEALVYVRQWKRLQYIDKPKAGRHPRPDGTTNYSEAVDESIGAGQGITDPENREDSPEPPENFAKSSRKVHEECPQIQSGEQGNRGTGEQNPPTPRRDEPPTPQRLPARTNNGVELARRQFSNLPARSATAYHIAEAFSAALPVPIEAGLLSGIGVQIDKCLKRGIPPPAIAAGLKAWTDSDSWSPTQIPNFVHKANNRSKPTNGKPTEKALGYDDALAELLTEVQTL